MKTYSDDPALATEWSTKALALMKTHQVAPLPTNYELWFRYASGQVTDLNEEIDQQLKSGGTINAEILDDLHQRFLSQASLADTALEAGNRLSSEVDKIMQLVQAAVGDNSELGTSVRVASKDLNSKSTPADIGRVVEAIMGASVEMEKRSKELEERLTETKTELNTLQSNLTKARGEARTDGLTGVNNRKAFDELLTEEVARANANNTSLCLIMGDIDHFKNFNDTWGHRTGDQVLRLVANCLKSGAREGDSVARYGGEEFAVIMPGTASDCAEGLANSIREAIQARELVKRSTGETLGRVTMSMGISSFQAGDNPASMIERADGNLYSAKRSGRNRVVADPATAMPRAKVS